MAVYKDDVNLQALYLLNETSGLRLDDTANNNDLTDNNTVLSSADSKEGANSADFEAANNEYLSITDAAQTGLDLSYPFSLVAWIKRESVSVSGVMCGKWQSGGTRAYRWDITSSNNVRFQITPDGSTISSFTGDTPVSSVATWYHVGLVADGTDIRFFLDGSLDSGTPGSWSLATFDSGEDFRLGRSQGAYFDGFIDEFAAFNKALSAGDVSSIFNNGIQDPVAGGSIVPHIVQMYGVINQ